MHERFLTLTPLSGAMRWIVCAEDREAVHKSEADVNFGKLALGVSGGEVQPLLSKICHNAQELFLGN